MNIDSYKEQSSSQRQQTMDLRMYERNVPSEPLQSYVDFRPVMTKYAKLPIVDNRTPVITPLMQQSTYTPEKVFNPGNNVGPWSGYASSINNESVLRNQIFALQSCAQSYYIPKSSSDLYDVNWVNKSNVQQPFPNLFKNEEFSPINPNPNKEKIGYALFNNATRQQTKELTKQTKCV